MLAAPATAQDKPPIIGRAEDCLKSNVDRVVAVDPDLESAANFLLNYSCAGEVSDASRYELNLILVKQFGAMDAMSRSFGRPVPKGEAQPPQPLTISSAATATVDPNTGEIILPPQKEGSPPDFFAPMLRQTGNATGQFTQLTTPVLLRKLAGALVLEAREHRAVRP